MIRASGNLSQYHIVFFSTFATFEQLVELINISRHRRSLRNNSDYFQSNFFLSNTSSILVALLHVALKNVFKQSIKRISIHCLVFFIDSLSRVLELRRSESSKSREKKR